MRSKGLLKKSLITLCAILIGVVALIQFPQLFLGKRFEYRSFIIFSNDNLAADYDAKNVLDSVIANLEYSEFYQPGQKFELYFINGSWYEKLIGLFGAKNIASSKFDQHIYRGTPNFKENTLVMGESKFEWVNLIQIITHEGVHSQMYTDYSRFGFMKTPSWINEGYCEYISYRPFRTSPDYALSDLYLKYINSDNGWIETEFKSMTPEIYLRDRLSIEYLLDFKNLAIMDIIHGDSLAPNKIIEEIEILFK